MKPSLRAAALTLVALALLFALYLPGLHGPFLVDDFGSIVDNPAVHADRLTPDTLKRAANSSRAGPLGRPIPMASFAVDHAYGGLAPARFKLTNVLLHLVATLLVFAVARRLATHLSRSGDDGAAWQLPLLIALLWTLQPLHVSTVLYAVQRMSQLAMIFVMAAVWVYIGAREQQLGGDVRGGWQRMALWIPLLLAGALLSKENGALLPVLLLAVEAVCFRFAMPAGRRGSRRWLAAGLVLPTAAILAFVAASGFAGLDGYGMARDFTPWERLLSQGRLLATHVSQIAWPDIGNMHFYYDQVRPSRSLLDPPSTLFAAVFWLLLIGAAIACAWRRQAPAFAFAVLWFVGAHLLESTTLPLELGFEHRNYLPAFGPALLAGFWFWRLGGLLRPTARGLLLAALPVALALQLHGRVATWASPGAFFTHTLRTAPDSARAWGDWSFFLTLQGEYRKAIAPLLRASELKPREAGYLLAAINLAANHLGEAPDAEWVREAAGRLERYPLTAYGHNVLARFVDRLADRTITPQGIAVSRLLLGKAIGNPSLRPDRRRMFELALKRLDGM